MHIKSAFVEVAEHPFKSVTVNATVKHPGELYAVEAFKADADV